MRKNRVSLENINFEKLSLDGDFYSADDAILKQRALKRIIKNRDLHFKKAKKLSDLCQRPLPGEQWRIVTEKQFNAYAVILYLLQFCVIDEMYLAIYRINEATVCSLIDLIRSGSIKKAFFVISNFFNQTKKPEKWANILKEFCEHNENSEHIYIHNHAKVLACRASSDFFIFEGSGNMSDNARIEQYLFENNENVFNFHKQWILELLGYK